MFLSVLMVKKLKNNTANSVIPNSQFEANFV